MYLAEAYCMQNQFADALTHLDEADSVTNQANQNSDGADGQIRNLVSLVEHKFRTIRITKDHKLAAGQAPQNIDEFLVPKIINKLNRCVVEMCQNNFEKAR